MTHHAASTFNFRILLPYSLIVIAVVFFTACSSKKEYTPQQELAIAYTQCFYKAYEDGGDALNEVIDTYEKLLVTEGFIEDASGKSYVSLFEDMVARDSLTFKPSKDFYEYFNEVKQPNEIKALLCNEQFKLGEKFEKSIAHTQSLGDWTPATFAKGILSEFTADDFDLVFYKMSFFFMFDTINYENTSAMYEDLPATN